MSGFAPTGTVTYTLYPGSTCTGTPLSSAQTVSLSGGEVPNSATTGALGAGAYSFDMAYSGDANYDPPTDSCEPFVVGKATPSASTQVIDAATYSPWSADEVTGARADDTATLVGVSGFTPTGTVTYTLYPGTTCTGAPLSSAQTVSLSGRGGPQLGHDLGARCRRLLLRNGLRRRCQLRRRIELCRPFVVGKATPSASTQVIDAATSSPWSANEVTGARAYDTATVVGVSDFAPTGTVTYTLYPGSTCTGTPLSSAQTVSLSGGEVPYSATTGALGAGAYSFAMAYGGDANYGAAANSCQPFVVADAIPSASTQVIDAATSSPWTGGETTGARAVRHRHRWRA